MSDSETPVHEREIRRLLTVDPRNMKERRLDEIYLLVSLHGFVLTIDLDKQKIRQACVFSETDRLLCVSLSQADDRPPLRNTMIASVGESGERFGLDELVAEWFGSGDAIAIAARDAGYISSNPDSSVTLRAPVSTWESYTLAPAKLAGLLHLDRGRVVDRLERRILDLSEYGRCFAPLARSHQQASDALTLYDRLETDPANYVTYNPLIYFCVYGHETYFRCLQIALESLDRFGNYDGTIGVISDQPIEYVRRFIPARYRSDFVHINSARARSFVSRYCLDYEKFSGFYPIVYMDIDVVACNDVSSLMIDVVLQDRICVSTEDFVYDDWPADPVEWSDAGNFFGKFLFEKFPTSLPIHKGNSGIIGAPNIEAAISTFNVTVEMFDNISVIMAPDPDADHYRRVFGDQPFLNHTLHRYNSGEFTTLDKHVQIVRSIEDFDHTASSCLVHLLVEMAVPEARRKVQVMQLLMQRMTLKRRDLTMNDQES